MTIASSQITELENIMSIDHLKDRNLDNLMKAVLSLKTIEECYAFFDDLCTVNEIIAMKQRLQVALLIKSGKTYNKIEKETGASSATISRVSRAMEYGSNGYDTVIKRLID